MDMGEVGEIILYGSRYLQSTQAGLSCGRVRGGRHLLLICNIRDRRLECADCLYCRYLPRIIGAN